MTEKPPIPGLTRENTGVKHDVYRNWYITPRMEVGINRREKKRSTDHVTDEPILHTDRIRAVNVGQTIHHDRKCQQCGKMYTPNVLHQKFCGHECKKAHNRAKDRAQGDAAIAERIARMSRKGAA